MSDKYYYVDEKSRLKVQIPASYLILELENGESFRLYKNMDDEVLVRCDGQLIVKPKSSNQIAICEN